MRLRLPGMSSSSGVAKMLAAAAALLLLAIGLCAAGGGFDTHVSQFEVGMSYAGALLLLVAFLVFIRACAEFGKGRRR